jgi:hypothetical protein
VKADVEQVARKASDANAAKATPIFASGEQIADFRAG